MTELALSLVFGFHCTDLAAESICHTRVNGVQNKVGLHRCLDALSSFLDHRSTQMHAEFWRRFLVFGTIGSVGCDPSGSIGRRVKRKMGRSQNVSKSNPLRRPPKS
ncbi:hypothetical protein BC940DRAFT_297623 [Gongronella butleri]|nr:hypothetical protein BC940DRAFT_297623 [Gongronella butleri]